MSHPDPNGPPDPTAIHEGEILENPVTRERATILELPFSNAEERATAELTALVGARVVGEYLHPAMVERFTVLEGELTVKRDGKTSILREGGERDHRAGRVARLVERERSGCPRARRDHAGCVRCPGADRPQARLSRHLPADLTHGAGAAFLAGT